MNIEDVKNLQVGDLVQIKFDGFETLGMVLRATSSVENNYCYVHICWFGAPIEHPDYVSIYSISDTLVWKHVSVV